VQHPEILVVGAGPAGLSAGLYAARSGHRAVILEKALPGGQVALTSEIENYPGFAEPISGPLLMQAMEQQARRFGCAIETAEATGLKAGTESLELTTTAGPFHPRTLIIATGVRPRRLGVPGENELTGRGVSYCAVCDGPLFKGKDVAVIGGGDSALDEALYLANICRKVYLIHRRDRFRGAQVAVERLRRTPNVEMILVSVATAVIGTDRVEALEVENRLDGARRRIPLSGVFIYVGSLPNSGWCADALSLDDSGFIKTDSLLRTNIPGVFAAGDVRTTPLRQIATSVGDGALAAMQAHQFLTETSG
jgi:thioredoxin reductase (NADPH)